MKYTITFLLLLSAIFSTAQSNVVTLDHVHTNGAFGSCDKPDRRDYVTSGCRMDPGFNPKMCGDQERRYEKAMKDWIECQRKNDSTKLANDGVTGQYAPADKYSTPWWVKPPPNDTSYAAIYLGRFHYWFDKYDAANCKYKCSTTASDSAYWLHAKEEAFYMTKHFWELIFPTQRLRDSAYNADKDAKTVEPKCQCQ